MNNHTGTLHIERWTQVDSPVGIVQIIHGMAEHSLRYASLAYSLNAQGYLVIAGDHRGHGMSASDSDALGDIESPFRQLVEDEILLTRTLRKEYPGLPLYILGHSMGSFMAQGHMKEASSLVRGYILSGSSKVPVLRAGAGAVLGRIIQFTGGNKKSRLMDHLFFAGYNRGIDKPLTSFDWLSRDEEVVRRYIEDPFCGFIYRAGFYASFLSYLTCFFTRSTFSRTDRSIPIFILSGDRDPVGLYGKGAAALNDFYASLGFEDVWFRLYPGGRHEMLNEINREEVEGDLLTFLRTYP